VPLVSALIHAFLDLAAPDHTRMRDVLATSSTAAFLDHVRRRVNFTLSRDLELEAWQRPQADASLRLGVHRQNTDDLWYVGGQPALGRLDAMMLQTLAALASEHSNATLRMTPWQSILLPDIAGHAVPDVLKRLQSSGLYCDGAHPLTRIIACTGSAGCIKGLADTKADARRLATRLPDIEQVHLSGCPRSCAVAHTSPYTLLAVSPGHYDLYRRDGTPGFGLCVARHLTIEQAAVSLERLARSNPDA
jgi:precorrin-3B synthase